MKNPEPLIQIFCKAPVIGQVKTRLTSTLGARGALNLYQQMFERLIADLSTSRFKTELWISPDKEHSFFQQYQLPRFRQTDGDLGASMCAALNAGLTRHESVILLGTDLPLIDRPYIEQAVSLLQSHDVVLGPAEDGGYGLVGVNAKTPGMFSNIDWGTERVLSQTCARLNRSGLDFSLLPLIWDVDRPADLPRYEAWLGGVS